MTDCTANQDPKPRPTLALFVTCLVNDFRPEVGFATIRLLQSLGFSPEVPESQTCCGQANYNNGDNSSALKAAQQTISCLDPYDIVIVPSASCAGMIRNHYVKLLSHDTYWHPKAVFLSEKTFELSEFLAKQGLEKFPRNNELKATITHHQSCSSRRETQAWEQTGEIVKHAFPRSEWIELQEPEACCGFGGSFCVKFNAISSHMGNSKLADIQTTQASIATSLDLGCLLHLESLQKDPINTELLHFAELIARSLPD